MAFPWWWRDTKCQIEKKDTEFFFPNERNLKDVRAAKAYCRGCPYRMPCAIFSVERQLDEGIYGGLTWEERLMVVALLPKAERVRALSDIELPELESPIHTPHTDNPTVEQPHETFDIPFVLIVEEVQEYRTHSLSERAVDPTESEFWTEPFILRIAL